MRLLFTIHGLPLASFPGSRAHSTFDPKRLGSKVVREIVYSSKEPGDEAIHGIVGVSRWATSAG